MLIYFSIIIGSSFGAISRHLVSKFLSNLNILGIPLSILIINIVGSFLMGVIFQYSQQSDLNENIKLILTTGFLSSFTTFSAFSLEAYLLFNQNKIIEGMLYIIASVLISLLFLYLGIYLIKQN